MLDDVLRRCFTRLDGAYKTVQLIYKVEPTLTFITHLCTFVTPRLEESLVRALPPKLSYSLTTIAEGTSSAWEPGTTMK